MKSNTPNTRSTSDVDNRVPHNTASDDAFDDVSRTLRERFTEWFADSASSYLISAGIHTAILLILALTLGVQYIAESIAKPPVFEADVVEQPKEAKPDQPLERFNLSVPPNYEPTNIDLDVQLPKAGGAADEKWTSDPALPDEPGGGMKDADPSAAQVGGGNGEEFQGLRPGTRWHGPGGVAPGKGEGQKPGLNGPGVGLGNRNPKNRGHGPIGGATKDSERAVAAALHWIARHQNADGSWSLSKFTDNCNYGKCDGPGSAQSDSGATAMGLLPFLAAGNTHAEGKYRANVLKGLTWLINRQKADGDLSAGAPQVMYSHGLCTIALCEAYAMSKSSNIGRAAQNAVKFIENAQNKQDGGWRYRPGDAGDTSVVGWQLMALKSAQMAELEVSPAALDGTRKWLASVSKGDYAGVFSYQPGAVRTPAMTSVGLLCRQYMGAPREDAGIVEGIKFLMDNSPDKLRTRNIYYWYYATQVVHNVLGEDWDAWNRQMRRVLIDTQIKGNSCDAGSWDPVKPTADSWGGPGGRIMQTSLSCLTLEIYYRYMPLHDLEKKGAVKGPVRIDDEKGKGK